MILLVAAKELLRGYRLWAGPLLVVAASSAICAAALAQFKTAATLSLEASKSVLSISQGMFAFSILAAIAITSATTNLAVAAGRRGYALLQLAGFLPRQLTAMVLVQLILLAALGTGVGIGIGRVIAQPLLDLTIAQTSAPADTVVLYGTSTVGWSFGVFTVVVLVAGFRAALRAGKVPPIEALREPEPPRIRMGAFRWVTVGIAAAASIALGLGVVGSGPSPGSDVKPMAVSMVIGLGMLLSIALTALAASVGPVLYPVVLRAWTALVPSVISGAWFLARRSCRYRITQSTAAITPLMVGIALPGSMYTLFLTSGSAMAMGGNSPEVNTASIFTLLGPALLLAAIGSAAVVFMTSRTRARDNALVSISGGTLATSILSAVFEAVIYVCTALMIATTIFGIVGLTVAAAFNQSAHGITPVYGISTVLVIALMGGVVVAAATVLPTITPTRRSIPSLLATE